MRLYYCPYITDNHMINFPVALTVWCACFYFKIEHLKIHQKEKKNGTLELRESQHSKKVVPFCCVWWYLLFMVLKDIRYQETLTLTQSFIYP